MPYRQPIYANIYTIFHNDYFFIILRLILIAWQLKLVHILENIS